MEYIDTGYYDEIMKAKIYPKIVYYYLKKQILFKEYWNVETQTENLKICQIKRCRADILSGRTAGNRNTNIRNNARGCSYRAFRKK